MDEVRTQLPFKSETPLGRIIGDTANSNGKVLAAFKPEADMEERSLGVCAVGAPVRDQEGRTVVAISVVAPKGRFGSDEQSLCAEAVRTTAASLSAYLGHSGSED